MVSDKSKMYSDVIDATVRVPCMNPYCKDGYVMASGSKVARVCPGCDGLGFLRSVAENKKRYYALRNLASELELQSRLGRELTLQNASIINQSKAGIELVDGLNSPILSNILSNV